MFAFQPRGLELNFFENESWDPDALNKFSWWTSNESSRYQATRDKTPRQWHGARSAVLRGLASPSAWCALLWGAWLTSSLLPGSRQVLEAYKENTDSTDWPRYSSRWLGYLIDCVPQKSGVWFTYFHRDSAYTFDRKPHKYKCILTPEVLWKCQIYAELKEEEVPGQENRAGLEPISTTCVHLIGLLQLLFKSRLLPSHFVDGRTGTVFIKCNVIQDRYPQSFFTLFLLSLRKQNDAHPDSSEESKFCKVLVES